MILKKEALMWDQRPENVVRCKLCPNYCVLKPDEFGKCGARKNEDGTLYSLVYGALSAATPDPIEKKPMFHFWPGSTAFSISSVGCTLHCLYCQNYDISQKNAENFELSETTAEEVIARVKETGSKSIAYTYNEPLTFYEFILDCGKLAHDEGLLNVLVTNGYITLGALEPLCPILDAANVDIKAITDKFHKEVCGIPRVKPILEATKYMKNNGVFVECTNLLVPGRNDTPGEIRKLSQWILTELGPDTPLHFSRFYPMYKMSNIPPTPINTLANARKIAMGLGLRYVYCGNVPGDEGENTFCPNCGNKVIGRIGFSINAWDLNENKQCNKCGTSIPVIGEYTPT